MPSCTDDGPYDGVGGDRPGEEATAGSEYVLGITMMVDGKNSRSFTYRVSRWSQATGVLRLLASAEGPDIPADRFVVSGLLDLTRPISLDGSEHGSFVASDSEHEYSLDIPRLSVGIHCFAFLAAEDPRDAISEVRGQDEISAFFRVRVGESKKDHCSPTRTADSEYRSLDASSPLAAGCIPNISPDPTGIEVQRRVPSGSALWAVVPVCSGSAAGIFVKDSQLQGSESATPPLIQPVGASSPGWIETLESLPSGGWNLLVIQQSFDTVLSQPVVVE